MGDSGTPSAFTKPDTLQLTTGADVWDVTTHDAEACWVCTPPPPPPCICRYGLFYVAGAVPTHALDPYANGWRRGVYAFHINELCTHHGIPALEPDEYDDLYPDGGVWGFADVLDEDERRGH